MSVLDPKDPDVATTYEIDWRGQLVLAALRSSDYVIDDVTAAQRDTGWYYKCIQAGRTARHYPSQWARAEGETTVDGSVIWEAVHPDDASVPTVSSADWTVPDGLTLDSQVERGSLTQVTLSGGTDGVDYDVLCRMTPTSGNIIEQTITVPVRAQ